MCGSLFRFLRAFVTGTGRRILISVALLLVGHVRHLLFTCFSNKWILYSMTIRDAVIQTYYFRGSPQISWGLPLFDQAHGDFDRCEEFFCEQGSLRILA
ncbi:hypothetical protein SAMN04487970_100196 [Paenibacillus tianmuensis]|uniref:Uncharacterized protein n=1 Tax=Paenibacillus tianmuensis TaxID=624147 RepID=A0A1G4P5B7_9BACL|nr:hypothetical protein SAMN04487970_100196 [Paenibacillus tianmuensis]